MLKTSLQLRMSQQLTMTPQLQQAIRLLQMPAIELQAHINELLESNVMLEADEEADPLTSFESLGAAPHEEASAQPQGDDSEMSSASAETEPEPEPTVEIVDDVWDERSASASDTPYNPEDDDRGQDFSDASSETLQEHLLWQLEMEKLGTRQRDIGRAVIDAINEDGYLTESLDDIVATLRPDIEADEDEIDTVLTLVQRFDPAGIGARNLSECVLLQLDRLDSKTAGLSMARRIAAQHLELLGQRDSSVLKRMLGISDDELAQAMSLVRSCHPKPGSLISSSRPEYIVPDVFVRRGSHGWTVEMNPSTQPRVQVNQAYVGMLGGRSPGHATLRAQLQEARWLLKSLEIRQDTLMRVSRSIVERQIAFLEQGDEFMKPMILRDIAESIEMHESTVSRITSGKYMHTPRGVFELRYFFSSHVGGDGDSAETSSTAIRAKIRKLIRDEPPATPLSDSRIAELLSSEGIPVARRTVAKYREAMGIEPSNERKRAMARV